MSHVEVYVQVGGLSFFRQQHSPGPHTQSVLCLCSCVLHCAGGCPRCRVGCCIGCVSGSHLLFHVVFVKGGAGKCYVTVFVYFSVCVVFVWPCEPAMCGCCMWCSGVAFQSEAMVHVLLVRTLHLGIGVHVACVPASPRPPGHHSGLCPVRCAKMYHRVLLWACAAWDCVCAAACARSHCPLTTPGMALCTGVCRVRVNLCVL